jgi:hypothetical protein
MERISEREAAKRFSDKYILLYNVAPDENLEAVGILKGVYDSDEARTKDLQTIPEEVRGTVSLLLGNNLKENYLGGMFM